MSQFTICILFRTPSLQFFDGNLYSSFRNSDKELCYFFTFSYITLMSSLPNPQSKTFSIILVSNRKPSTVFHQLTSRNPLSFFSTIYIQCFTIDIINFSLLLTHSLHFRLVRILLLFQNFYIIFFLPLFQRTSDVSESEMPRTKYLTMSM